MKEEMEQEACLKIMKNLKNMKEEKRKQFFSYWSCCCWTAFVTYLRNHYKHINQKRKLLVQALERAQQDNANAANPELLKRLQDMIELCDNTT